jgi:CheY-like chemotaxis protein
MTTNNTRKTIIIVDDISFQLMSIKDRLKAQYKVYPAQSVEILFSILEQVFPDLILMDLNMPAVDGYEAIEMLKSDVYAMIPVIALSSSCDKKSAAKAKSSGAADFLPKPFGDTDLIDAIEFQLNPQIRAKDKPIILAIDDEPSILKSIQSFLNTNYKVYTLPFPGKIKDILNMVMPDLFLLDCNMPKISGFDLIPVIRKYPEHADTPIIFSTTENTSDNISTAIALGAKDYILKPINPDILRNKLEIHLDGYIIQRRIRRFPT